MDALEISAIYCALRPSGKEAVLRFAIETLSKEQMSKSPSRCNNFDRTGECKFGEKCKFKEGHKAQDDNEASAGPSKIRPKMTSEQLTAFRAGRDCKFGEDCDKKNNGCQFKHT